MLNDTESLAAALRRLENAELIERLPTPEEEQYGFSHSITQDVAYDFFLLQRRSELHARAGAAIEAIYGDSLAPHYEMLAEHYARSDNVEKAIHYGERAARKAARTFALTQAQRQYGRVIQLLDTLPETPERVRRQIDLSAGDMQKTQRISVGQRMGFLHVDDVVGNGGDARRGRRCRTKSTERNNESHANKKV